eukprot:scaffold3686_cov193-Alexandrium_tamarense.AAC.2
MEYAGGGEVRRKQTSSSLVLSLGVCLSSDGSHKQQSNMSSEQQQSSGAPARSQTPDRNRGPASNRPQGGRGEGRGGGRGNYQHSSGRGGGRGDVGGRGGHSGRGRGGGRGNFNNNMHPSGPRPQTAVPYGYLPPFLPGSASIVEQLDQRMLVVLRDGRHLVGTLRTFDQFANMVLEDTSERRILVVKREEIDVDDEDKGETTTCYQADVKLGLYVVRGDVVVLMGEVDDEGSQEVIQYDGKIRMVSLEEFEQLEEEEMKRREESGEVVEEIDWDFDMDLVA